MRETPKKYEWLLSMKDSELRAALRKYEGDLLIVYDHCGLDVLISLWEHLAGIPLYPSKKACYKLAADYVRRHYDPRDSAHSKKQIAATVGASLRFVELVLESTDEDDPRQMDAFKNAE